MDKYASGFTPLIDEEEAIFQVHQQVLTFHVESVNIFICET